MSVVNPNDIESQIELAQERIDSDENCMHGMTYEQGVKYALEWISGYTEEKPLEQ